MRVALLSDIHGNLPALDAVLDDARALGADRVVCLGDLVDLGPDPAGVVARLRRARIPCVRGNHDPLDDRPASRFLDDIARWTATVLSDDDRRWLRDLPRSLRLDVDGVDLWCVHGSPRRDTDNVTADTPREVLEAWIGGVPFDVLACGHTHVQCLRRLGRRVVVNVGSVSMPFLDVVDGRSPVGLPWAEYALLDGVSGRVSVTLRQVAYDVEATKRAALARGMPHARLWADHWSP